MCVSCEYSGTASVRTTPVGALGIAYLFTPPDTIAETSRSVGVAPVPARRYSVTRSRYASSGNAFLPRTKVSIAMNPSPSPCRETEVRRMSPSPDAQMPSVYHLVSRAEPPPCISILIQVFAGVAALHDATSSSYAKTVDCQAPVHVPLSYGTLAGRCGSAYVPEAKPEAASVTPPPDTTAPLVAPAPSTALS